jgi:hypothetical protein
MAPASFRLYVGSAYSGVGTPDGTNSNAMAAAGGGVGLRYPGAALCDSVGWGTATNIFVEGTVAPAPPNTASPQSIGRFSADGQDTNVNSADFHVAGSTPRAHNN